MEQALLVWTRRADGRVSDLAVRGSVDDLCFGVREVANDAEHAVVIWTRPRARSLALVRDL